MRGAVRIRSTESFGSFMINEDGVHDPLGAVDPVQRDLTERLPVGGQGRHRPGTAGDAPREYQPPHIARMTIGCMAGPASSRA